MQLPIVAPAPLVTTHAGAFRDLFENRRQFRHFQNYLTGLMVLFQQEHVEHSSVRGWIVPIKPTCPVSSRKRPGFKRASQ